MGATWEQKEKDRRFAGEATVADESGPRAVSASGHFGWARPSLGYSALLVFYGFLNPSLSAPTAYCHLSSLYTVSAYYYLPLQSITDSHIGSVNLKKFLWFERACGIVINIFIKLLLHRACSSTYGAAFA